MALDDTKWNPKMVMYATARDIEVIQQIRDCPMPNPLKLRQLLDLSAMEVIDIIENMIKWRKPNE